MSNFKIGEKVVCVDSSGFISCFVERKYNVKYPLKNEIYTIRDIISQNGLIGLRFFEIINTPLGYNEGTNFGEKAFNSTRFRKLDHDFAENLLKEISEAMKSETILN